MSKWRDDYRVHPYADSHPKLSDEELRVLGEDIKANGLKNPIVLFTDATGTVWLLDGRSRLEAMERAGVELDPRLIWHVSCGDPINWIMSLNLHRRQLSKEKQAELIAEGERLIAEATNKLDQAEPVSHRGGRGKKNPIKTAVVARAKKQGISESTAKRGMAKAAGKKPKPNGNKPVTKKAASKKPEAKPKKPVAKLAAPEEEPIGYYQVEPGIDAARRHYLSMVESDFDISELGAEENRVIDGLRAIAKIKEAPAAAA